MQNSEKQAVKQLEAITSGLSSAEQRGKSPNLSWETLAGQYSAWLSAPLIVLPHFCGAREPGILPLSTGFRRQSAGPVLTALSRVLYLAPKPKPAFQLSFEK